MISNQLLKYSDKELEAILCPNTTLAAWTFKGEYIREAIEGKRVLNPSIDLSNTCNLNCPYCYVEKVGSLKKEKSKFELNYNDYVEIINNLKKAGAKTINIIGAGEPTVDKDFYNIAGYIKSIDINVLVATNGIEISKSDKLSDFLCEIEASIVLKVNSFKQKLQDELVGKVGYSEYRDKALNKLIKKGFNSDRPTRLGLNTLLMKANIEEVFDIFTFCRENNITYIAGNYMPTGRTQDSIFQGDYLLNDIKRKELFEPISTTDYSIIRKKILDYDRQNKFPVNSPDAYISGLPCIQGLGLQIDNIGKIWHCPTRQQIKGGILVSEEVGEVSFNKEFIKLWNEHEYLESFRNTYTGKCPYKQKMI